jgi:threonine synthase
MRYVSTRGGAPPVSFLDAVLAGLAPDGGLYVPESWPALFVSPAARRGAANGHFSALAATVLKAFAGDDIAAAEVTPLVNAAYVRWLEDEDRGVWPPVVTPLVQQLPGVWTLELFHGPSLSFKDVALQLIGPLLDFALTKRNRRLTVLCATSGDTGGAAVEALKGRERIDLFVLLPKGRVSDVQRRFMTTSGAANVHAIEIDGDFDACQAIVKAMLQDADFAARAALSGVNSINWARILAQSVYYHAAAHTLAANGPVSFVVPTGNFGDAFSGYVAKRCGAPIGKIALAVNANDILARALETGRYERARASHATLSPAMDIQVASNFERILFEALGRDGAAVRSLYERFAQSGGFDIPPDALAALRADFDAVSISDEQTAASMRNHLPYLACPHTAVGLTAVAALAEPLEEPVVTLATAHPAKFPDTVEAATGIRPALPAWCAGLPRRAERIEALANDAEAVKRFIGARARAFA